MIESNSMNHDEFMEKNEGIIDDSGGGIHIVDDDHDHHWGMEIFVVVVVVKISLLRFGIWFLFFSSRIDDHKFTLPFPLFFLTYNLDLLWIIDENYFLFLFLFFLFAHSPSFGRSFFLSVLFTNIIKRHQPLVHIFVNDSYTTLQCCDSLSKDGIIVLYNKNFNQSI